MKAIGNMHLRVVLSLLLFLFISCRGEDPDVQPGPHVNSFSAIVNGTPFETSKIKGSFHDNDFGLTGIARNKHEILLATNTNNTRTGHYILTSEEHGFSGSYYEGVGGYHALIEGISGKLVITKIDNTTYSNGTVINGTFSFTTRNIYGTENNYVITDGEFSVYIEKMF